MTSSELLTLLVDLVLGVMGLEFIVLLLLRRLRGQGPRVRDAAAMLLAGALILLAWRSSLTGAPWYWVALWLGAAGLAHASDLRSRWPR